MKFRVLVGLAAVGFVSLSACGSLNTTGGLAGTPVANAIVPLASTVMVTARYGKSPIPHLEMTLTRGNWPKGKLIAKGKTGPMGRVMLSGNWTGQETICVGGRYVRASGVFEASHCERPFPRAVTVDFQPHHEIGRTARRDLQENRK
jgi:hypothetical protein